MKVAPFTGAWIEIGHVFQDVDGVGSLPLRERGLKSRATGSARGRGRSLPLRERGLKFDKSVCINCANGRSLYGSVD